MKYFLFSLVAACFITLFTPTSFALAGDMVSRTCDQSVLKYHPKLLVAKRNDHRTGYCLFRVDIPPEMASDGLTRSAVILRAALQTTDSKEFDKQVVELGPAIVDTFFELLRERETDPNVGFEESLKANFETVTACAAAAARKKLFESKDNLLLTCGFNPEESNFFFTAVHNDVTLEIVLPFA